VMMMNGSRQDWKFTTIQQIDQTRPRGEARNSPRNESVMVLTWPRTVTCEPRGTSCRVSAISRSICVEMNPRFGVLHRPVDVDTGVRVIVTDDAGATLRRRLPGSRASAARRRGGTERRRR